jgi:hypothetical protein
MLEMLIFVPEVFVIVHVPVAPETEYVYVALTDVNAKVSAPGVRGDCITEAGVASAIKAKSKTEAANWRTRTRKPRKTKTSSANVREASARMLAKRFAACNASD